MPPATIARLAARRPLLLEQDPRELAAVADELQALLGLHGRGELVRVALLHQPYLLLKPCGAASANVAAIASALGAAPDAALRMCRRQPALMYARAGSVAGKAAALGRMLGADASRGSRLAVSWPTLVCMSSGSLAAKLSALSTTLGESPDAVRRMCLGTPALLERSPAALAARRKAWERAAAGSGHMGDWRSTPQLLLMSERLAEERWRLLKRLAPLHAPWSAWMARRGGAQLLMLSSGRWLRAEYAAACLLSERHDGGPRRRTGAPADAALPAGGPLPAVVPAGSPRSFRELLLAWSDADVEAWLPGFQAWHEQLKKRGQVRQQAEKEEGEDSEWRG